MDLFASRTQLDGVGVSSGWNAPSTGLNTVAPAPIPNPIPIPNPSEPPEAPPVVWWGFPVVTAAEPTTGTAVEQIRSAPTRMYHTICCCFDPYRQKALEWLNTEVPALAGLAAKITKGDERKANQAFIGTAILQALVGLIFLFTGVCFGLLSSTICTGLLSGFTIQWGLMDIVELLLQLAMGAQLNYQAHTVRQNSVMTGTMILWSIILNFIISIGCLASGLAAAGVVFLLLKFLIFGAIQLCIVLDEHKAVSGVSSTSVAPVVVAPATAEVPQVGAAPPVAPVPIS